MIYRVTVMTEIYVHPDDRAEFAINDLLVALRDGLRINPRIAQRITAQQLLSCELIEPKQGKKEEVKEG